MASTTRCRRVVKQQLEAEMDSAAQVVGDQIEALARQGARTMLMAALGEEVDAYLGRGAYERGGDERG